MFLWTCSSHFNKTEEVRGRMSEMVSGINNNFGVHTEDLQGSAVCLVSYYLHRLPVCILPQQLQCNI